MKRKRKTVQLKLLITFLSVIGVFFAFSALTYWRVTKRAVKEFAENLSFKGEQYFSDVSRQFERLITMQQALAQDYNLLLLANFDYDENDSSEIAEYTERMRNLSSSMNSITLANPLLYKIHVCFTRYNKLLNQDGYFDYDGVRFSTLGTDLFEYQDGTLYLKKINGQNFFLVGEMNVSEIEKGLTEVLSVQDERAALTFDTLTVGDKGLEWQDSDSFDKVRASSGESYYRLCRKFGNVTFTYSVSEKTVQRGTGIYTVLLAVMFGIFALGIVVYFAVSYRVLHRPLYRLQHHLEKLAAGEYGQTLDEGSAGEFDYLYASYNELSTRLKTLIDSEYKNRIAMQEMNLKQLQTQIDPHFLFNCFLMLKNLMRQKRYALCEELMGDISEYFKTTITFSDEIGFLDEVEHAAVYARIQNKRYKNDIRLDIAPLPPAAYNLKVPKFILQPIIENAFVYAFDKRNEEHCLKIGYKTEENYLIVAVENDGEISDDGIAAISERILTGVGKGRMSALNNIHNRLKIFNGSEKGLTAERGEMNGLKMNVYVRIRGGEA